MLETVLLPSFWAALFGVTLIQLALGADNLDIWSDLGLSKSEIDTLMQEGIL